jgi:hypothetical protein
MKKTYICPKTEQMMIQVKLQLMTGSDGAQGTTVSNSDASSSLDVLSRGDNTLWDEED